ncbi:hypothetical protein [Streptomyces goshikiensis]|uniref:hypothetical protein n=1 Tax=Streptomyces goshikiensis TaxID=1942 RepID=UPI00364C0D87
MTRQASDFGREPVGGVVGHVVHLVASAGWSWAALAFAVGWVSRSWRRALWLAPASLLVAVVAYYLVKMGQGEFRAFDLTLGNEPQGPMPIDWNGFLTHVVAWGAAALIFGPPLGWAGASAREPHLRGLASRLVVPLIAVVDMSLRLPGSPELDGAVATNTWTVVRILAVTACALLAAWAVHTTVRARRTART